MADQKSENNNEAVDTLEVELEITCTNAKEEHQTTNESDNYQHEKETNHSDIQRELHKLHRQPTIKDVINQKVTFKEYFEFYHLLRVAVASTIAVLIFLSMFVLAWVVNPNTCKWGRVYKNDENKGKLQKNPFLNQIVYSWRIVLTITPLIYIFGTEFKYTYKKMNRVALVFIILVFIVWMPSGFLLIEYIFIYQSMAALAVLIILVIYIFAAEGFYLFWLIFPFCIAVLLYYAMVSAASRFFEDVISPNSIYFSYVYNLYVMILQQLTYSFYWYQIPYGWGRCFTCCCHKNKVRLANNHNQKGKVYVQDELSDRILYYYSVAVISVVESYKMSGVVTQIHQTDGFSGLFSFILISILSECFVRNNLFWEIVYRCILRKSVAPARTRYAAIFASATIVGEYIPIWLFLFFNLFHYGPYTECGHVRDNTLSNTVNIDLKTQWWILTVIISCEVLADLCTEIVLRIGRCLKLFGVKNENNEDPPRKRILVKINLIPMIWIVEHCYILCFEAFLIDNGHKRINF